MEMKKMSLVIKLGGKTREIVLRKLEQPALEHNSPVVTELNFKTGLPL